MALTLEWRRYGARPFERTISGASGKRANVTLSGQPILLPSAQDKQMLLHKSDRRVSDWCPMLTEIIRNVFPGKLRDDPSSRIIFNKTVSIALG